MNNIQSTIWSKYHLKYLFLALMIFVSPTSVNAYGSKDPLSALTKQESQSVRLLINAINSGEPDKVKAVIERVYSADFLEAFPLDAHVDYLMRHHTLAGQLKLHGVHVKQTVTDKRFFIELWSERMEIWYALIIEATIDSDTSVTSLHMGDTYRPKDLPDLPKLTISEAVEELKDYTERLAQKGVFSGAVHLAKGEEVLYQSAFGLASKRYKVANNIETKFSIGSMNKMFTSIAIMQLIEQGKLSLSDKLSQFADESWLDKKLSSKIEIRHLLTHSSGLGNYFNQTFRQDSKNKYRKLNDYKHLVKSEKRLEFEPGTESAYSNTGMLMLGVVIEHVSGKDYFDYIQENIYQRAGMTNSDSYEVDQPVENLAVGYHHDPYNKYGWSNNYYTSVLKGSPAGGGFSTVKDLHLFALALTNYRLLNKQNTEALYTKNTDSLDFPVGYGFFFKGSDEDRVVGHAGGTKGISAFLDIYLDRDYIVTVLSNHSEGSIMIENKIRELLKQVKSL